MPEFVDQYSDPISALRLIFAGVILISGTFLLPFRAKAGVDEKLIPPDWAPSLPENETQCKAELEAKETRAPSQGELNESSTRLAEWRWPNYRPQ